MTDVRRVVRAASIAPRDAIGTRSSPLIFLTCPKKEEEKSEQAKSALFYSFSFDVKLSVYFVRLCAVPFSQSKTTKTEREREEGERKRRKMRNSVKKSEFNNTQPSLSLLSLVVSLCSFFLLYSSLVLYYIPSRWLYFCQCVVFLSPLTP